MSAHLQPFRLACLLAASQCRIPVGRLFGEYGLDEFLTECVKPADEPLEIAVNAVTYFCEGLSPAEAEFQFATVAVCLFLQKVSTGANAAFPTGQLADLVSHLKAGWSEVTLRALLANLY